MEMQWKNRWYIPAELLPSLRDETVPGIKVVVPVPIPATHPVTTAQPETLLQISTNTGEPCQ